MPSTDRYITGDCPPWKRTEKVIARCKNGHLWPTVAHHERGSADLHEPECPEPGCGEEAESWQVDDGE